jgi:GNAT superfamily N-acetyltransferase
MKVTRKSQPSYGLRFAIDDGGTEIARAYLYVMQNDLHTAPFGLLEDVFVEESRRGGGLGTQLVTEVVAAAREAGCYKLIATSRAARPKVHELYRQLGFHDYGIEFRLDLNSQKATL